MVFYSSEILSTTTPASTASIIFEPATLETRRTTITDGTRRLTLTYTPIKTTYTTIINGTQKLTLKFTPTKPIAVKKAREKLSPLAKYCAEEEVRFQCQEEWKRELQEECWKVDEYINCLKWRNDVGEAMVEVEPRKGKKRVGVRGPKSVIRKRERDERGRFMARG